MTKTKSLLKAGNIGFATAQGRLAAAEVVADTVLYKKELLFIESGRCYT